MHGKDPGQQNKLAGLRSPLYHQHQTSTGLCDKQVCHVQHSTRVSLLNRLLHTHTHTGYIQTISIFAKTYRNVVKTKQNKVIQTPQDTRSHKLMQESSVNKVTQESYSNNYDGTNPDNNVKMKGTLKIRETKRSSTTMLIHYSMGGPFPASALEAGISTICSFLVSLRI